MPLTNCYIGIDPGKSGGIAYIVEDECRAQGVFAHKMPDTDKDVYDMLRKINDLAEHTYAMLESVASSPQMGARSIFTFGRGYGALNMALVAVNITFDLVKPQKWQAFMGCMSGGDKAVTKARAQGLFPFTKVTHATADALLIAEYCHLRRRT
jgi:hypothetical protein